MADTDIIRILFRWGYKAVSLAVVIFKIFGMDFRIAEVIICILCAVYAALGVYFWKNDIDFRYDREQTWESYRAELKFIIVFCLFLLVYTIAG